MNQSIRRTLLLALSVAAISSSAKSQDAEPRDSTVQEVIAACDSTDAAIRTQQCDGKFGVALMAAVMEGDHPSPDKQVCLPNLQDMNAAMAVFKKDMLGWLRVHPEVQTQSFTKGSFKAFQVLYICKR